MKRLDTEPLISIIIPAFNAASVLGDALGSVQRQQYPHFQTLIVDDGSSDGTAAIARRFVEVDQRFVLLQQPHRGISAARNAGLAAARGEWIAFLDADDVWFAEKLTRQLRHLRESPGTDVIFSNYYFWDGQTDLRLGESEHKRFPVRAFTQRLTRYKPVRLSTVMVTRDLLARVGRFDVDLEAAEDWDLWLRLAEAGCRAQRIREPLTRYRLWSGNTTKQTLRIARATVRMLKNRAERCPDQRRRRWYRLTLSIAQGSLEFAAVRPLLDARPESLAPATLRAWQACPWHLKWLAWSMAVRCPGFLGGNLLTRRVSRQVKATW